MSAIASITIISTVAQVAATIPLPSQKSQLLGNHRLMTSAASSCDAAKKTTLGNDSTTITVRGENGSGFCHSTRRSMSVKP
jgi:hypothetical protein